MLPLQGAQFQSLIGELRSSMSHSAAGKRNTKFANDLLFVKYKSKEIQSYSYVTLTCIPSVLSREKRKAVEFQVPGKITCDFVYPHRNADLYPMCLGKKKKKFRTIDSLD